MDNRTPAFFRPGFEKRNLVHTAVLSLFICTASVFAGPMADSLDKFLGNIISGSVPSNYSDYWNQVTPENAGKWGVVERRRDVMSWDGLDQAYDYARENGFLFKQHTFVWGYQEPSWIGGLSEAEQREEVEEWMQSFAERYPDVEMIDVVNEPINRPASFREALGGAGETGWDWIIWSFEKAREYFPDAKLLINEYDVMNNDLILQYYLEIINLLKERGLIDAIGIQSHCFSVQETNYDSLTDHLNQLAETGLPIYSTEFDILGEDTLQMKLYSVFFPFFWEHPSVAGVTIWGWQYNRTWIDQTWLLNREGGERPALTWLREYMEKQRAATVASPRSNRQPASAAVPVITTGPDRKLSLQLSEERSIAVSLFDMQGRRISSVPRRTLPAGKHLLPIRNQADATGTRLAVITFDEQTRIKMVLPVIPHP